MAAKNPTLPIALPTIFTYRCGRCASVKLELSDCVPTNWFMLYGWEDYISGIHFCSLICMFTLLGQKPFGLEQMSVAVKRIVNDKYFGKAEKIKRIHADSCWENEIS